jgi:hypothetical protein
MIIKDENVAVEAADVMLAAELRATMLKIEAILKADDCAAFIIVAKPGGAHVRVTLDATWSCARIDHDGSFAMSTSSLPSDSREKTVAQTGNVLNTLADLAVQGGAELTVASEYVNERFGLEHSACQHIPDTKPH